MADATTITIPQLDTSCPSCGTGEFELHRVGCKLETDMLRWTPRRVLLPEDLSPKTLNHLLWILSYPLRNWRYLDESYLQDHLRGIVHVSQRAWWRKEIRKLWEKYNERECKRIRVTRQPMPVVNWLSFHRSRELHSAVQSFVCRKHCLIETSVFGCVNTRKSIWFDYCEGTDHLFLTIPNSYRIVKQDSFLGMFKPYQRVLLFQTRNEHQPVFWLTHGRGRKIHFHTGYNRKGELIEVPALPKLMPGMFHVNEGRGDT